MTTPTIDPFTSEYLSLGTQAEQEAFARRRVADYEAQFLPGEAHTRTVALGRPLGLDFTAFLAEYQGERLPSFSPETIQSMLPEEAKKLPMWKRAFSRTLKTIDWYVENINKPVAAIALGIGSSLVPGEQSFEKELTRARREIA
ncbi:hypothetical protein LCGC14_2851270, partial [marine sediment metagenome]